MGAPTLVENVPFFIHGPVPWICDPHFEPCSEIDMFPEFPEAHKRDSYGSYIWWAFLSQKLDEPLVWANVVILKV